MKILIEGYHYDADRVRHILRELSPLESVEGEISVGYVGYYYNSHIGDCVFILPKVLLDSNDRVFSHIAPSLLIDPEQCGDLTSKEKSFIYEFAVWTYRTIEVFNKSNPSNDIIYHKHIARMGNGKRRLSNTYLDIILSLLKFGKERQDYFTTTLRNLHSGNNKINWGRTISRSVAWVQDSTPIYFEPVNRKRVQNDDEELIIIYLSILRYISETYGFRVSISLGFELIRGGKFDHYLNGYGKRRLKQIKYRYFSDVQLQLWELCYGFFDRAHHIRINSESREYLLAKNFNIVFEAMIDELIGDPNPPAGLKEQEDGKRVDHIYRYQSLTSDTRDKSIFYIGDSKYYKIGNNISKESVHKQFTYARNVIQWNLNLFLDKKPEDVILRAENPKYRDDQTEGYNIIPNFFISAKMDEKLSYADNVSPSTLEDNTFISRQFENRLFDRDTLLVYHYDVNFLYIISLYARENTHQKNQWKHKVRGLFREKIQAALQKNFDFYAMAPKPGTDVESYVRSNFQELLGKVYRPYSDPSCLSLALDKTDIKVNQPLLSRLGTDFYIKPCKLGEDPTDLFADDVKRVPPFNTHSGVLMVMMEQYELKSKKFLPAGEIAIGIKPTVLGMEIIRHLDEIGYILFHIRSSSGQHLFPVYQKPNIMIREEVDGKPDLYVSQKTCDIYLHVIFDTGNEIDSNGIDAGRPAYFKTERYDPCFCHIRDLQQADKW